MATRTANEPQVQLKKLGGLDQRPAASALDAPNFDICHGVYQARAGSLTRLEGITYLATVGPVQETGFGVGGIWSIWQPNDGTDNIIIQNSEGTEYIFTLNELFQRTVINDLTYLPLPDDNDMPTAILVQTATNGTDLANIGGASANTWYQRPLTANPVNESSIVVAFAANTFEVAPGTYRIRGWVTAAAFLDLDGGGIANTAEAGFQAVINDTTNAATLVVGSPASVKGERGTSGTYNIGPLNLVSLIDSTFEITGSNAVLEVQNAFSSTVTGNGTVTVTGGAAANVSTVINGAAVAQPYVWINLAKVA